MLNCIEQVRYTRLSQKRENQIDFNCFSLPVPIYPLILSIYSVSVIRPLKQSAGHTRKAANYPPLSSMR